MLLVKMQALWFTPWRGWAMVDVLQLISISFEHCLFCHHAVCVGIENFLRLELFRNHSAQNMQALCEILIYVTARLLTVNPFVNLSTGL